MSQRSPAEAKCPICRRPTLAAFAPFCSPRCQDRDLLNWLGDGYALPGDPVDPDDIGLDKREGQD
ncbi:MAG TPA: DNA gyrase inhibitor YacG [Polymorphobacter sp.]|jgi:hypothetical protein|nr:DNA gyrase inhibitor YacG [Polymorphobacter sp.]